MKRRTLLSLITLCLFLNFDAKAALPDGTVAPDWTLTDLNGNTHHLYSILASGRDVVIDFSATWCGPCWNYHNTGTLDNLWHTYGPGGTNEIMVFFIEGDGDTNTACLYGPAGCNDATQGNWVSSTSYPIINLEGADLSVTTAYQISYWPTLYGISANTYEVYEVGQETVTGWENWLFESFPMAQTNNITPSICPEQGAIDLNVTDGYLNVSYSWSNGMNTEDITGLDPGVYSCTISDQNNYMIVADNLVVGGPANGPMMMSLNGLTDVNCFGDFSGAISVSGSGGNGGTAYNWNNGMTGPNIQNIPAGNYTVSMTDVQGCLLTQSYSIVQPTELINNSATVAEACDNGNGEVYFFTDGGVAPYSYNIGNGPVPTPYFLGLTAGNYSVDIMDMNGCIVTESITINSEAGPTAMAAATNDIDCTNTQATVSSAGSSSGGDISYAWTTSDGNIVSGASEADAIVDAAGTYTLNVTDNSTGCVTTTDVMVSSLEQAPTADVAAAEMLNCIVTEVILDGSNSSSGTDINYEWTDANGTVIGTNNTVDVAVSGVFTLVVTDSSNGCTEEAQVTVNEDTTVPSVITSNVELTCTVTSMDLCATVDAGNTVEWTTPTGTESGECISVSMAGDYTALVTSDNGCTNEATATVTNSDNLPQIEVGTPDALTCTVEQIMLDGSITGDVSDHTISWATTDGTIDSGENTLTPTISAPGTYVLTAVNDATGCTSSLSIIVEEEINLPDAAYAYELNDGVLDLIGTNLGQSDNVSWDLGNGTTGTGGEVSAELGETGTYNICMSVTNDCGTTTDCQEVFFVSRLKFGSESADARCYDEASGTILVTPSGGLPEYSISWTGPNGFTSDLFELNDLEAGTYMMVLTDDYGYVKEESFEIDQPTPMAFANEAKQNVSCFGSADGSISLDVEGGTSGYTYMWSDGNTDINRENLEAGEYMLEVTDANGCIIMTSFDITQPSDITQLSATVQDDTNTTSTGSISFNAEGGSGSLTYEWSNGAIGSTIDGLPAGDYAVVVTDENECSREFGPFTVGDITGVDDLDFVQSFEMFPNPTVHLLNIEISLKEAGSNVVRIIDGTGKTVYLEQYSGSEINTSIDVSGLSSGLYFFEFGNHTDRATERFLVIK